MKRLAFLLLTLWAASAALAQDGRVSLVAGGPVTFTVTAEAMVAAAACPGCHTLYPDSGTPVVLEVRRQNPNRFYTLDVFHNGFTPLGAFQLEARYAVTNERGNMVLLAIDWRPVTEAPGELFTQQAVGRETSVRVEVAYRLRLVGSEPPGLYQTTVTYSIRENASKASHDVRAAIPSFLSLRLVGAMAPALAHNLRFDYGEAPQQYVHAVSTGTPLPATASDLARVEISTNHPGGYTVTVRVEALAEPLLRDRLYLAGALAHGRRLASTHPTRGFVTLVTPDDFSLVVDGSEPPGAYVVTVTYEAILNP